MEIQQKLAKKLFCIEICGKGEREIKEFILGPVIFFFFFKHRSREKKNFLPLKGIQGLLRKAGSATRGCWEVVIFPFLLAIRE